MTLPVPWATFGTNPSGVSSRNISTTLAYATSANRKAAAQSENSAAGCLLVPADQGPRTVLVAATQPGAWAADEPLLNFALAHFTT